MANANLYLLRPKYILTILTTISIVISDIGLLMIYLIFQQVTEDSVLSGKFREKVKLTEPKS